MVEKRELFIGVRRVCVGLKKIKKVVMIIGIWNRMVTKNRIEEYFVVVYTTV